MKVWIVEPVGYGQYGIMGVYASLKAAQRAYGSVWKLVGDETWETEGASAVSDTGYSIYADTVKS
jgi:hypothetical protein